MNKSTVDDLQTQLKASFMEMVTAEPFNLKDAKSRADNVLTLGRAATFAASRSHHNGLDNYSCLAVVQAAILLKDEPGGLGQLRAVLAWTLKRFEATSDDPTRAWLTAELDKVQPKGSPHENL